MFQYHSPDAPTWEDANCYNMSTPYLLSDDNWFFYGGTGKTSSTCNY